MQSSKEQCIGLRGYLLDAPVYGSCRGVKDGAILIQNGKITEIGDYESMHRRHRAEPVQWREGSNLLILPGLIDTHCHLPQYPAVGRGGLPLLPWLRQHIFPLEREFNAAVAKREAPLFFTELARNGTTTAVVYTAIFEESCDRAFSAAEASGLRILMGKMMMDVGSYGSLQPRKIPSVSLSETERLFNKWNGAADGLLEYVVSPRFAVSCTERLMRGAAEFAKANNAYIQTHLSENREEIERVRNLFGQARDYTDVYYQCGLLGSKTILGHCIHLSPDEIQMLVQTESRVAHCPTSNLFLGSGIMSLDLLMEAGLKIGLGSDVAAGPELCLWAVMRSAVESQQARSFYQPDVKVPTPAAVFHLATQGAADLLGKGEVIGSLEAGKEADVILMDAAKLIPYPKRVKEVLDLPPEEILALCVYRGSPQAVVDSYVRGKCVYHMPHPELFPGAV